MPSNITSEMTLWIPGQSWPAHCLHPSHSIFLYDSRPDVTAYLWKYNSLSNENLWFKSQEEKRGQKLPISIISKLKEKNALAYNLHSSRHLMAAQEVIQCQHKIDTMKDAIKDTIFTHKLHCRHKLRSKLLLADPTRKKCWRFLKGQIKSAGNISATYDKTGKMVFDQHEIKEAVVEHFGTIFRGERCPICTSL